MHSCLEEFEQTPIFLRYVINNTIDVVWSVIIDLGMNIGDYQLFLWVFNHQ